MDFIGYAAVAALLGFFGWLIWLAYATNGVKKEVEEIKTKLLLTPAEVKKLTKPKLLELAGELDLQVDPKLTKAKLVEEIEKIR